MNKCELCKREGDDKHFEKHHLVPQNKDSDYIIVCHQCGDQIHLLFDNTELKYILNTKAKILNNLRFEKYLEWVKKRPLNKHFTVKKKKKKK